MDRDTFKANIESAKNMEFKGRNSMGCDERWYNEYYLIYKALGEDFDIETLTNNEMELILKVAREAGEAFY